MRDEADEARRIEQVLGGDPEGFDRWYRAEHPRVWRLCFGFVADAEEADDLAQDAMLKLHDRLSRRDPGRPWREWRNSVVLNLCRDRLRRRAARERAEASAAKERAKELAPDASHALTQRELREAFAAALGELTEREREAFVLRELEGSSTEATAQVMGVGVSTVRSLLTLARRRLREHLGRSCPELVEGGDHA